MSSSKIDTCWVQRGLDLDPTPRNHRAQDRPPIEPYSINASEGDVLFDQPIYLTVEVKQGFKADDPRVQLARWSVWSRLNETRCGVQTGHFVLPAITVEDHLWRLYLHSYDADARHLVGHPGSLALPRVDGHRVASAG
jgi:hypothetical protein